MVVIPDSGALGLTVRDLLTRCAGTALGDLTLRAGANGIGRRITRVSLQKTGLALTGQAHYLEDGRVLLFGRSEVQYLAGLGADERRLRLRDVLRPGLPCIVITGGLAVDPILVELADTMDVPVLSTDVLTSEALVLLTGLLEEALAPVATLHGVLVDILGLGVLLLGESGIGKSECALDLVVRGHRLVADDAVEITRRGSTLIGTSPALTRHHMELRGLGIMNVQDLFGVASTRQSVHVELLVRLVRWEAHTDCDRLGLEQTTEPLLGVQVPVVALPVAPGRNIGILVEVAARRHLLLARGNSAAQRLVATLEAQLRAGES